MAMENTMPIKSTITIITIKSITMAIDTIIDALITMDTELITTTCQEGIVAQGTNT